MIIVLLILLGAGVFLFIFAPVLTGQSGVPLSDSPSNGGDDLMTRKQNVYNNILDLDFEYSMGRVAEEDYVRLREEYKRDAGAILEKIDRIEKGTIQYDEWIERAVAMCRNNGGSRDGAEQAPCPHCRKNNNAGNKFCTHCGHKL